MNTWVFAPVRASTLVSTFSNSQTGISTGAGAFSQPYFLGFFVPFFFFFLLCFNNFEKVVKGYQEKYTRNQRVRVCQGAQQQRICLPSGRHCFNPCVTKIPWRRKWKPFPIFLPGKFHGQRSLAGHSPGGLEELHTIQQLNSSCNQSHHYVASMLFPLSLTITLECRYQYSHGKR